MTFLVQAELELEMYGGHAHISEYTSKRVRKIMHELPLVKKIFNTVVENAENNNAAKVTRVVLEIGVLRDFVPFIVQRYWNYVSKDTIADGSIIEIDEVPATAECGQCKTVYPLDTENVEMNRCPKCFFDSGKLVTGKELRIKGIEIETTKQEGR